MRGNDPELSRGRREELDVTAGLFESPPLNVGATMDILGTSLVRRGLRARKAFPIAIAARPGNDRPLT